MMDEIFRQEPGCEIGSDSSGLLKWGSTHAGYDGLLGLWQIFARQLSWFLPVGPLVFVLIKKNFGRFFNCSCKF